jgi:hypothetical protein
LLPITPAVVPVLKNTVGGGGMKCRPASPDAGNTKIK